LAKGKQSLSGKNKTTLTVTGLLMEGLPEKNGGFKRDHQPLPLLSWKSATGTFEVLPIYPHTALT
jgi:hypothetical protein